MERGYLTSIVKRSRNCALRVTTKRDHVRNIDDFIRVTRFIVLRIVRVWTRGGRYYLCIYEIRTVKK